MAANRYLPDEVLDIIISYILPRRYDHIGQLNGRNKWEPRIWEDIEDVIRLPDEYKSLETIFDAKSKISYIEMHLGNAKYIYTFMRNCPIKSFRLNYYQNDWSPLFSTEYADEFWSQFLRNVQVLQINSSTHEISKEGLEKLLSYTPKLKKLRINGLKPIKDILFKCLPQSVTSLGISCPLFECTGEIMLKNITQLTISTESIKSLYNTKWECFSNVRELYFALHFIGTFNIDHIISPLNLNFMYFSQLKLTQISQYHISYLRKIPHVVIKMMHITYCDDMQILSDIFRSPNIIVQGIYLSLGKNPEAYIPQIVPCLESRALMNLTCISFGQGSMELVKYLISKCHGVVYYTFGKFDEIPPKIVEELYELGYEEEEGERRSLTCFEKIRYSNKKEENLIRQNRKNMRCV